MQAANIESRKNCSFFCLVILAGCLGAIEIDETGDECAGRSHSATLRVRASREMKYRVKKRGLLTLKNR
jgi:hypothetical protein